MGNILHYNLANVTSCGTVAKWSLSADRHIIQVMQKMMKVSDNITRLIHV